MRLRLPVLIAAAWLAHASFVRAQPAELVPPPAAEPAPAPAPPAEPVAPPPAAAPVAPVEPPAAPPAEPQPESHVPPPPPPPPATEIIGDDVIVAVEVPSTPAPEPTVEPQSEPVEPDTTQWMLQNRRFSTRDGSTGGLWIEEPSSGVPGAVRIQLALNIVPEDDFAETGNDMSRTDKAISVSWTPLSLLEVYGVIKDSSTSLELPVEDSIYQQGSLLGFKLWKSLPSIWSFGGGLRFGFNNEPGSGAPLLKATNIGLRAGASADLQDLDAKVPLIARFNLEYLFDNSAKLVEGIESDRYAMLEASNDGVALPRNETRNLVTRTERYALGMNRVDMLTMGLGVEAPLAIGHEASIHPLLEYRFGLPVNRQDFDCAIVRRTDNDGDAGSGDDCLATAGAASWPMNLALGARVVPPVRGLSFMLALDLGLTGSSKFVRELAPNAPFSLVLALSYDYDARP